MANSHRGLSPLQSMSGSWGLSKQADLSCLRTRCSHETRTSQKEKGNHHGKRSGQPGTLRASGSVQSRQKFRQQAEWWLNHVQTRKRKPIKRATAAGFESYLNKWLRPNLGDMPVSSVNNLAVRGLVTKMTDAGMSPKMVNNVIQVVKMVVASAVNENGERVHPRTWNHEFIDLPEVKDQRQPTFTSVMMKAIAGGSKGREQMLFVSSRSHRNANRRGAGT